MEIVNFTPVEGLVGGLLIGLAVVAWLWLSGRVTGCSGILHGAVFEKTSGERGWRWLYMAGLIIGVVLYQALHSVGLPGAHFTVDLQVSGGVMLLAGLLVGFGTRLGNGCTSGHGVCGISRWSMRSIVATCVFMLFGFVSVWVFQHLLGV